ncbi:MAG: NAD-dependent epimerase/dehydratase family protein, partial [Chitinophagaceae bacterium]
MKILVTGATGFIGNYVIEELLKRNTNVIATSTNIEKAKNTSWFKKVQYIPYQFTENIENNLVAFFNYPDIIIHLAWQGLPNYKADFHITKNLYTHKAFIKNLIENGLHNINITGTCFEYGMQEGELKEEMECKPDNAYAIAKNELRIYCENLQKTNAFNFKWLRLFYTYGFGQNENSLIPQLNKAIKNGDTHFNMSGGEQIRDFLPIEEVAKNIVTIALQKKIEGIFNCCSGQPIKVKNFVQQYLSSIGKSIELNLGFYPYTNYEPMEFWG